MSDDPERASDDPERASDDPERASDEAKQASDEAKRASDDPEQASDEAKRASDDPEQASDETFTRVRLTDWAATAEVFRAFDATVTVENDQITLVSGNARFVVSRDGSIEGAMPLHELERTGVERLSLDPDEGVIRFTDGRDRYEFRVP